MQAAPQTERSGRRDAQPSAPAATDQLFRATALYFGGALLLGGAGVDYPLITGAIELGGVALLCYVLLGGPFDNRIGRFPLIVAVLIAILPLAQLIPLPPSMWMSLPGRELPARILTVAGLDPTWRPLSLEPESTIRSALALLPGFALFFATCALGRRDRLRLVTVVLACAAISALLGALQKATGADPLFTPFPSDHSPDGPGLFVNRNHQCTFLLVAIVLLAAAARFRAEGRRPALAYAIAAALFALFAGAVVATTSKAGIALFPIAFVCGIAIMLRRGLSAKLLAAGIGALVVIAGLAAQSSGVRASWSRFGQAEARFDYWADAKVGISNFWPAGSGIGSFATIFPSVEDLNHVDTSRLYNAHNDYLELAFEGGVGAVIAFAAFLLLFLHRIAIALRPGFPAPARALALAAAAGMAIILLHSIVDYPLRMLSIMALAGALAGWLVAETSSGGAARRTGRHAIGRPGRQPQ